MKYIKVGKELFIIIMIFFAVFVFLSAAFLDIIPTGVPLRYSEFNLKTIIIILMILDFFAIWGILKINNINLFNDKESFF